MSLVTDIDQDILCLAASRSVLSAFGAVLPAFYSDPGGGPHRVRLRRHRGSQLIDNQRAIVRRGLQKWLLSITIGHSGEKTERSVSTQCPL